jgi:tetrahydromethanopterin S-methyltransferase subunit B
MGTRGYFGFRYKGKYYMVYNHFDSYDLYDMLIMEIVSAIDNKTFDTWITKLENIKCITCDMIPTQEQIDSLQKYTDLTVSSRSTNDWYCLLRKCQASYESVLDAGIIQNCVNEDGSLMHEEFTHVLNFDDNTFISYHRYGENEQIEKLDDIVERTHNATRLINNDKHTQLV